VEAYDIEVACKEGGGVGAAGIGGNGDWAMACRVSAAAAAEKLAAGSAAAAGGSSAAALAAGAYNRPLADLPTCTLAGLPTRRHSLTRPLAHGST